MFKNSKKPTMSELVNFLTVEFTDIVGAMKHSLHETEPSVPNPYHMEGSVWAHTMMVCKVAEMLNVSKENKIIALLHDCGKPQARTDFTSNDGEHRVHFRNHEAYGTFIAIDVLERLRMLDVINTQQKGNILKIISIHGDLFNGMKGKGYQPSKIYDKFLLDPWNFETFITQVKCDSLGRFSNDDNKIAHDLGCNIYTEDDFFQYLSTRDAKESKDKDLNVFIGVPGSGKTTTLESYLNSSEHSINSSWVISRDDIMMKYAESLGIIGSKIKCANCTSGGIIIEDVAYKCRAGHDTNNPCVKGYRKLTSYSDVWKYMQDNDLHKEIDKLLEQDWVNAVKSDKNIFIDMTNMSKKSQKKWGNKLGKKDSEYNINGIFFACGDLEYRRRVEKRRTDTGKFIDWKIINSMKASFNYPTSEVFDNVTVVWG